MVNPATGVETDYEELWRSPRILATPSKPGLDGAAGETATRCVVLRLQDYERGEFGMVVLLGQYCQGLLRKGDTITVERWQWEPETRRWKKEFKIGRGILACSAAIERAHELKKDSDLVLGSQAWRVVELVSNASEQT